MHFDLNSFIGLAVAVIGLFVHHAIKTPSDSQRASLLTTLAGDAAAVVVNFAPNAPWAMLLSDTVQKLQGIPTTPTEDPVILERAAAAALVRLGKTASNAGSATGSIGPARP